MKLIGLVMFAAVLLTAVVGDLTTADRGCSRPAPTPGALVVQDLGECRFPQEHGAYPGKSAKSREALHASGGDQSPNREAQCIGCAASTGGRSETVVHSIAELNNAVDNAQAGDTIILADGAYSNVGRIDLDFSNVNPVPTASNPITVRPQTPGGAVITGDSSWVFMRGKHITVSGFHFRNIILESQPGDTFFHAVNINHCRITDCKFETIGRKGSTHIMDVKGQSASDGFLGDSRNNRIDHLTFEDTRGIGIENFIVNKSATGGYVDKNNTHNVYDHLLFVNGEQSTQKEALQIGRGGASAPVDAYLTVEYCMFDNYDGDNETISNKSSSNTIRYNVLRNCNGHVTVRIGDDCKVYGNYVIYDKNEKFAGVQPWREGVSYKRRDVVRHIDYYWMAREDHLSNSSNAPPGGASSTYWFKNQNHEIGLRVAGTGHQVYNNYMEGIVRGIRIVTGNSSYPAASNLTLAHNTVIGNTRHGIEVGSGDGAQPVDCLIANNIVTTDENSDLYYMYFQHSGATNITYQTNLAWPTGNMSVGVSDPGIVKADPQLAHDGFTWNPSTDGAADSVGTPVAGITDDIRGQARDPAHPDIGHWEIGGATSRPPVTRDDVGVSWE